VARGDGRYTMRKGKRRKKVGKAHRSVSTGKGKNRRRLGTRGRSAPPTRNHWKRTNEDKEVELGQPSVKKGGKRKFW